ncbi:MAG: methylornithine synthase PylB [Deltaproteobacteria bacterium]|nr:methylornithine synthase PylB [Deltaproteobacteria bacterium]
MKPALKIGRGERSGTPSSGFDLEEVLFRAKRGEALNREEIGFFLDLEDDAGLDRLFQTAREIRSRCFEDSVFLYGFVYFSTWCRNDCTFCLYRRSNLLARRYRKSAEEILEIALRQAESGVHLIDLTMGEDPFFDQAGAGADELLDLVERTKVETGLPVMISPGVVSRERLQELSEAGADWYACYQETHNPELFRELRPDQDFHRRLAAKIEARRLGMLIEEGILTGVGDSSADILASLEAMRSLGAHQLRVMTFVPQRGTPMGRTSPPTSRRELVTIALMRLLFPDRLIPASLDVGGIKGLQDRLLAGANVVTSLIPPRTGLVGVSQSVLDVEEGYRTVGGVRAVLERMGLKTARAGEYGLWIARERARKESRQLETGKIP